MSRQRGCPATWTSPGAAENAESFYVVFLKRTASAPASSEPSVTLNLTGNSVRPESPCDSLCEVYIIRVWAVNEAGAGPAAEAVTLLELALVQVMGQTGAIAPGLCGAVRVATEGEDQAEAAAN